MVLDSCIYHCFAPGEERGAYVANLERLVKPGGWRRVNAPRRARVTPTGGLAGTGGGGTVLGTMLFYHVESSCSYLANPLLPGGRIIMLVFSDKEPGTDGPHRCSQADIRGSYPPPGWQVGSGSLGHLRCACALINAPGVDT